STRERLTRRVVGPVNLLVAVDARPANDAVAPVLHGQVVVDRRWMPGADVAALTEHRRLGHQHAVVGGAVWIVAAHTALAPGGVLEQERASLLRVTGHTALVDPAADGQLLDVGRAMRIVAT